MEIGIPKEFMDLAVRIANALEDHNKLAKEDLAFRREQSVKGEQQQAALLQMFLPPQPHAEQIVEGVRRKRREG